MIPPAPRRSRLAVGGALLTACCLVLTACQSSETSDADGDEMPRAAGEALSRAAAAAAPSGTVTLAFAGDVHFEGGLEGLPGQAASTLGPMSAALRGADLAVVNLESALTTGGRQASKGLEVPQERYWFRSPPAALDLLDRSGVDVVSMANNHGADYGLEGLRDTLRIAEQSPVAVVGVGADEQAAYAPHRATIRGTDVAVFAADASPLESENPIWSARPGTGPGLATARGESVDRLVSGVAAAARTDDVVAVYLHWGEEGQSCPTPEQQSLAAALTGAGADVVVGTHAHMLQGSGMLDGAYVSYGLGNFFWYHGIQSETGVLRLRITDGEVVDEDWRAARIPPGGGAPQPVSGADRRQSLAERDLLRTCADLEPAPVAEDEAEAEAGSDPPEPRPAFEADVTGIGPALRERMTESHDPSVCPVPLRDLRYLTPTYVDFEGRVRRGEIVVHADVAQDVVTVFRSLYAARFPIRRMVLVDEYGGDDDRSMAANNTSGYNCRTVAGQDTFSDHAYGRAIDINPVQNPYVLGDRVLPAAGRRFVEIDRGGPVSPGPGIIRDRGVVTRAFDAVGWEWGGLWSDPDYQHFSTG